MTKKETAFGAWRHEAHGLVQQVIREQYASELAGNWHENNITGQLLLKLESVGTHLIWSDYAQHVKWRGLKYSGKPEQTYGDIAVFVRVALTDNTVLEGVAYYEAKRQYFTSNRTTAGFAALDLDQLVKINENTQASHVLLYDMTNSNVGVASALPTSFVIALMEQRKREETTGNLDRELHRYGRHWIDRLGSNLLGYELDFSEKGVQSVKDYIRKFPGAAVLLTGVAMSTTLEPELPRDDFLSAEYVRLDTPDRKPDVGSDLSF
ncbi:hypothetical protein ACS7SF_22835 (plasmid) [Ralstonia sp. 25C]|uniref:hypothetical protein n=1 Tax=Ralstonia sp. 25C TaxID=3447363 RepID=UPI003F75232F